VNILSCVGYMFRSVKLCKSHSSLIMIYYALSTPLCHMVLYFGANHLIVIKLQKRAIRITIGRRNKDSCRTLNSWELYCLNHSVFFSIHLSLVKNRDHFATNYDSHSVLTRQRKNFHLLYTSSIYQQDVHYSGV
jgi:hypothetical protein